MKLHFCGIIILVLLGSLFSVSSFAQTQLVKNLQLGKSQTLVVYGTSLTAGAGGKAWVNAVGAELNRKFYNRLTVYNSGKSSMWSTWAYNTWRIV